jgi:hypothetical protein
LYVSNLPKDYSITGPRLIRLWVVEGFIKDKKGKPLKDVAQEYLKEHIHRNLVQVSFGELDYEVTKNTESMICCMKSSYRRMEA